MPRKLSDREPLMLVLLLVLLVAFVGRKTTVGEAAGGARHRAVEAYSAQAYLEASDVSRPAISHGLTLVALSTVSLVVIGLKAVRYARRERRQQPRCFIREARVLPQNRDSHIVAVLETSAVSDQALGRR